MVDQLDLAHSDEEEIVAPRSRHPRTIYSNSEASDDSESELEGNDTEEELRDFRKVTMANDSEYNPRPQFMEIAGPKHMPERNSMPRAYFDLFFTEEFLSLLRNETNRYARQFLNRINVPSGSRTTEWKATTVSEVRAFIAVLLEMGITRRPTLFSYWSTNHRQIPWFGQMFSRNRFQLVCRFFHVVDNEKLPTRDNPEYDPIAKFQPVVIHANNKFKFHYSPNQHLSIDKSLVGTKCRTSLIQYLPNKKHHRWGIKFWMLTDAVTHYCLSFFCYRGARDQTDKEEIKKNGLGHVVIHKLLNMSNYFMKGYHVVADNFFTSIPLARALFERGTYLTGTIRSNRKYIPSFMKTKLQEGASKYARNNEVLLLAYREKKSQKKNVLLMSTFEKAQNKTTTIRKRNAQIQVEKPAIVAEYNKHMGGVDTSEMMLYSYLDERRAIKYWKIVVFSIFSRMVLNAYILYRHNTDGKTKTRLEFITDVIQSITTEWLALKRIAHDTPLAKTSTNVPRIGVRKLPGKLERVWVVCSRKDGGPKRKSRTDTSH
ncbi:piggyBac transposable element-derived protein 4-like [Ctenocephalides felis]|uniref:piggyBac transposable element-derived protein 4-like n=1 Tax=Ctenocephalides felis TaxID=7515 RepID=UPI000E6E5B0F|nr:piggyBac transposable element-derived protein 4-like [Ctenocephalides felis]